MTNNNAKMASYSAYHQKIDLSCIFEQPGDQTEIILYEKESRSPQTCSLCQNHDISVPKKGHNCKNDSDEHLNNCEPCRKTKLRRDSAAKDKKNNYQKRRGCRSIDIKLPGKQRNEQKCRKCANHGIDKVMKEHKTSCEFKSCKCEECVETDRRRIAVKQEAKAKRMKVKRSNNSSPNPQSPNSSEFSASSPASSDISDSSDSYQNFSNNQNLYNNFIKSEFLSDFPSKHIDFIKEEHAYAYERPASPEFSNVSNFYINNNQNLINSSMEIDLISEFSSKRVYFTNDENTNTFTNTAVYYESSDIMNSFIVEDHVSNFDDNDYKSVLYGIYQGEFNLHNVEKDLECWYS